MIQHITPVILCGGSGSRLWPLPRTGFPKQFLCLTGNDSLFQQAAQRLNQLGNAHIQASPPLIVTGEEHRFLVTERLRETGIELGRALLEPVARNTAPALTLAAKEGGQDPIRVVTPADQTVAQPAAFTAAMHQAIAQAATGNIVILGITPHQAETGYGYIKTQSAPDTSSLFRSAPPCAIPLQVMSFVEKPNQAAAESYLQQGGYWDAGMFVLKASVWLQALQQFRPDIAQATQHAWGQRSTDAALVRPGKAQFTATPAESIDYAVMERCPGSAFPIQLIPLDAGRSNLGAWDALWSELPEDQLRQSSHPDRKPIHLYPTGRGAPLGQPRQHPAGDHRQSGSYLGEDDIVRFEDTYGREKCWIPH
jgi:mannose-1-phosphate guanylyltransferase/mannose-6-phosphate isomerase